MSALLADIRTPLAPQCSLLDLAVAPFECDPFDQTFEGIEAEYYPSPAKTLSVGVGD
jgi:hypothetical protein